MSSKQIKLGDKVRCKVTGFTGIAVAKVEYLNGCIQFGVKPKQKAKENTMPDVVFIDVEQLEIIGGRTKVKKRKTGGVMQDTPSASYNG